MSPIDDELRAALHGRAQVLAPSPDPLAGIERRAKRIQRTRVGAAVAGSALAVVMVAVAVPAVQNATTSAPEIPRYGTTSPSAEPTPSPMSRYALDPSSPWAYRGDPGVLENGNLETSAREWAARHRVDESDVRFSPLYGELYEPTAESWTVYVATAAGQSWWGVVQSSESGPEFLVDEQLADNTLALPAAVPGDELGRLLVVAAPDVGAIEYGHDDASEFDPMESIAPGVAVTALDGDPATDSFRVLDQAGEELVRRPAPDAPAEDRAPTNGAVLDPDNPWELRGDRSLVTTGQLDALREEWATRHAVATDGVTLAPLYISRYQPAAMVEVFYLVRSGSGPWSWGVSALGEGGWAWYVDERLKAGTAALPAALPGDEGVERLVIVAAPFAGAALYAGNGSGFEPMTDIAPGVFITPIEGDPTKDRYKVVDGNGDLDNPIAEGEVPAYQNAG